ncbi:MAG: ATP-dependent sacrificial sulfur transferase LarE [Candidatus Omnitrophica bacterium]|nr:ATP-dependent sacrificial sulfur transferase LarE [Candidatus Omnitrophota bacterium]
MSLTGKLTKLKREILNYHSCVLAFSGGVDSTFLLKAASQVLPKNRLLAVTALSETYPQEELVLARKIARSIGVAHKVIRTHELSDRNFSRNPIQRCYYCKKELFTKLRAIARRQRFHTVADASTISDRSDFRPGTKAKIELKVRSPLQEAGFSKEEIRRASKQLRLSTWNKPSLACLASRIPYGTRISAGLLSKVNNAERYLKENGFSEVRVRDYNGLCRIEVPQNDIPAFIRKRARIVDRLKRMGYNYVTLDLQGLRSGSMNEVLKRKRE